MTSIRNVKATKVERRRGEYLKILQKTLNDFVRFKKHSQIYLIVEEVCERTLRYATKYNYSINEFDSLIYKTIEFIEYMQAVLNPLSSEDKESSIFKQYESYLSEINKLKDPKSWIWIHRDPVQVFKNGEKSGHYWLVSDEISEVCHEYLNKPWLNCGIVDKILIDSMIYKETLAFGEVIKAGIEKNDMQGMLKAGDPITYELFSNYKSEKKWDFYLVLFKEALIIFLCFYLANEFSWVFGVVLFLVLRDIKKISFGVNFDRINERKKELTHYRLLNNMQLLSNFMNKYPLSPVFIKEQLYLTAKKGAVWHAGLFPILDNAIRRKENIW